ncbi:NUDIX hydrolase domain [Dillenia turbinata]|uniref:NUDIX hydrolase domain n=1 Tax=Dillenia turbinata TaxID=194707 RepID=A0AAN8W9A5_9MAGN
MAANCIPSPKGRTSFFSAFKSSLSHHYFPKRLNLRSSSSSSSSSSLKLSEISFTWDDVVRISQSDYFPNDSSDLTGYFDKVKTCNRGVEMQTDFIPFVIEEQIVGYIHNGFAEHLRRFQDVFVCPQGNSYGSHFGGHVSLHPSLRSPDDRTEAVGDVIKCLGPMIPGIRNESYGVHMNGYVDKDGEKYLWIGIRSKVKPTYPGMLDHLVAGGLPHGIACGENLLKECEEEAGIPQSISSNALSVGAVSYMDIEGHRFKRDVLFCYDLKLPEGFVPHNEDGEVEDFKLIPVSNVANVIRRTHFFKPNCSLVIIDFLFRHGYDFHIAFSSSFTFC